MTPAETISGARTSANARPPGKFQTSGKPSLPSPPVGTEDNRTADEIELAARMARVEHLAAERGLQVVQTVYGPHAVKLIRIGGGGLPQDLSGPEGISLDALEDYFTETDQPSRFEALRIAEALSLLRQREPRNEKPVELTAELRNKDKTATPKG
jgi:hypothetical protein